MAGTCIVYLASCTFPHIRDDTGILNLVLASCTLHLPAGRDEEALALTEEAFAFRMRVLPENHPDTMESMVRIRVGSRSASPQPGSIRVRPVIYTRAPPGVRDV